MSIYLEYEIVSFMRRQFSSLKVYIKIGQNRKRQLLNEENVIVDAPGVSNTKIAASQTKHWPYFVEYGYKNGNIICECAMYKGSDFLFSCACCGLFIEFTSNFLQWRTKKKVDLNLTALKL